MDIFGNLLFKPFTEFNEDDPVPGEQVSCLGIQTREKLYKLLLKLAEDTGIRDLLVNLLDELFSSGMCNCRNNPQSAQVAC